MSMFGNEFIWGETVTYEPAEILSPKDISSLSKIIANMENEIDDEGEPAVKEHLKSRIDAIEKDRQRIRDLFPDMKREEWDDNTD